MNKEVDTLAKLGSQKNSTLLGVIPLIILKQPSVPEATLMQTEGEEEPDTWVTPIWKYIKEGQLPEDKGEARRLRYKATRYVDYERSFYRRGFNSPLFKCISGDECNYILR